MRPWFRGILWRISGYLAVVAIPSFLLFLGLSVWLGGDALNGGESAGRYYVASHGDLTEVSRPVFLLSWWLGAVMIATFIPMVILGGLVRLLGRKTFHRRGPG